jgi:hypothetical protein
MSWIKAAIVRLSIGIFPMSSAHALCINKGKMYAKTTIPQEFFDSKWVVKVKVVAADNHWSDVDDSWTLYHLQVVTTFKGAPPSSVELFTYRDSGGFYLDKGTNADLDGEYLLFLDPIDKAEKVPYAARSATEVNYSCGQSKLWREVSSADQKRLADLSRGTH